MYSDICMQRMCFYLYKESFAHMMVKKEKKYFKKPVEASTVPPNCAQTNGFNEGVCRTHLTGNSDGIKYTFGV